MDTSLTPQNPMQLNLHSNCLFDTTFFSDLLDQQDLGITLDDLVRIGEGRSGYSIITLAELYAKPVSGAQRKLREQLLQFFICYQLTEDSARRAGDLHRKFLDEHRRNPLSRRQNVPGITDCLIAATAHAHQLTWVTRDKRHGPRFLRRRSAVRWWASPALPPGRGVCLHLHPVSACGCIA